MGLLATVAEQLERVGVPYAAIGAIALAAHGVARATADVDLLVLDSRALRTDTWTPLSAGGVTVEIRVGDHDDPLAGVVRFERGAELPVEIIAGKPAWQRDVLERSNPTELFGRSIPVVQPADLILLKLYAGGIQDLADIGALLEQHRDAQHIRDVVAERLALLDERSRSLWRRFES